MYIHDTFLCKTATLIQILSHPQTIRKSAQVIQGHHSDYHRLSKTFVLNYLKSAELIASSI